MSTCQGCIVEEHGPGECGSTDLRHRSACTANCGAATGKERADDRTAPAGRPSAPLPARRPTSPSTCSPASAA